MPSARQDSSLQSRVHCQGRLPFCDGYPDIIQPVVHGKNESLQKIMFGRPLAAPSYNQWPFAGFCDYTGGFCNGRYRQAPS